MGFGNHKGTDPAGGQGSLKDYYKDENDKSTLSYAYIIVALIMVFIVVYFGFFA